MVSVQRAMGISCRIVGRIDRLEGLVVIPVRSMDHDGLAADIMSGESEVVSAQ